MKRKHLAKRISCAALATQMLFATNADAASPALSLRSVSPVQVAVEKSRTALDRSVQILASAGQTPRKKLQWYSRTLAPVVAVASGQEAAERETPQSAETETSRASGELVMPAAETTSTVEPGTTGEIESEAPTPVAAPEADGGEAIPVARKRGVRMLGASMLDSDMPPFDSIYAAFGFGENYGILDGDGTSKYDGFAYNVENRVDSEGQEIIWYNRRISGADDTMIFRERYSDEDGDFQKRTDGKYYLNRSLLDKDDLPRLPDLEFSGWYVVWDQNSIYRTGLSVSEYASLKTNHYRAITYADVAEKANCEKPFDADKPLEEYKAYGDSSASNDLLILAKWDPSTNATITDLTLNSTEEDLTLYPVGAFTQNDYAAMTRASLESCTHQTAAKELGSGVDTFFARVPQGIDKLTFTLEAFEPGSTLQVDTSFGGSGTGSFTFAEDDSGTLHRVERGKKPSSTEKATNKTSDDPARGIWTFNGDNCIPLTESNSDTKYNVVTFTVTAPDGTTTKTYTVYVQRLTAPVLKLEPGNTPAGMIARDTDTTWIANHKADEQAHFAAGSAASRKFTNAPSSPINNGGYIQKGEYVEDAWAQQGRTFDGDLDAETIVVYQNSEFDLPGFTVYDGLGNPNDVTSTGFQGSIAWSLELTAVDQLRPEVAQTAEVAGVTYSTITRSGSMADKHISLLGKNVKPGLYRLKYTFNDLYDGLSHLPDSSDWSQSGEEANNTFYRTVVVLPIRGDVDMDGQVTVADGEALGKLLTDGFFNDVLAKTCADPVKCLYAYRVCDVDGKYQAADSTNGSFVNTTDVNSLLNGFQADDTASAGNNYFYIPLSGDTTRNRRKATTGSSSDKAGMELRYLGVGETTAGLDPASRVSFDPNDIQTFWVDVTLTNAASLPAELRSPLTTLTLTLSYDPDYLSPYVPAGQSWFDYILSVNPQWAGWISLSSGERIAPVVYPVANVTDRDPVANKSKALPNLDQTAEKELAEIRFSVKAPGASAMVLADGSLLKVPFQLVKFPLGKTNGSGKLVELTLGARDLTVTTTAGASAWNNGNTNAGGVPNPVVTSVTANLADYVNYGGSDAVPLGEDKTPIYYIYTNQGKNPVYQELFTSQKQGQYTMDGVTRTAEITAIGSSEHYTVNGRLPQGVSLIYTGNLVGTPKEAGTFDFTITYPDATTSVPFRLVVEKAPLVLTVGDVIKYYGETDTTTQTFTYDPAAASAGGPIKQRDIDKSLTNDGSAAALADLIKEDDEAYVAPEISLVADYATTADGDIRTITTVTAATTPGEYTVLLRGGSSKNYRFLYAQAGETTPSEHYGTAKLEVLKRPVLIEQITKDPAGELQANQSVTLVKNQKARYNSEKHEFTFADLGGTDKDGNAWKAPLDLSKTKAVVSSDGLELAYDVEVVPNADEAAGAFVIAEGSNYESRDGTVRRIAFTEGGVGIQNSNYDLQNTKKFYSAAGQNYVVPQVQAATTRVNKRLMNQVEIKTNPGNAMRYTYGETLDMTGLLIWTSYTDGGDHGEATGNIQSCLDAGLTVQWVSGDQVIPADGDPSAVDGEHLTVAFHNGKYLCFSGPEITVDGVASRARAWLGPFEIEQSVLTLTLEGITNTVTYPHVERYYGESITDWIISYDASELSSWDAAARETTSGTIADLAHLTGFAAASIDITPRETASDTATPVTPGTDIGTYYAIISGAASANYTFEYSRIEINGTKTGGKWPSAAGYGYLPLVIYPRPILVTKITSTAGTVYHDTKEPYLDPTTAAWSSEAHGFVPELPQAYNASDSSTVYINSEGAAYQAQLPLSGNPIYDADTLILSYKADFKTNGSTKAPYFDMGNNMHIDVDVSVSKIALTDGGKGSNYVLLFTNVNAADSGWFAKDTDGTASVIPNGGGVDLKKIVGATEIVAPADLDYTYGEKFTLEGMYLTLWYIDGTKATIRYSQYGSGYDWPDTFAQQGLKLSWVTTGGEEAIQGQKLTVAHSGKSLVITGPTYKDEEGNPETPMVWDVPSSQVTVHKKELTLTAQPQTRYYGESNALYQLTLNQDDLSTWDRDIYDAWVAGAGAGETRDNGGKAAALDTPAVCPALTHLDSGFVGPVFVTAADERSNASAVPYALTLSGGSMANYTFRYVNSGIRVKKRPIDIKQYVVEPIMTVAIDSIDGANGYTVTVPCYQNTAYVDDGGVDQIRNDLVLAASGGTGLTEALVNNDGLTFRVTVRFDRSSSDFTTSEKQNDIYQKRVQVSVLGAELIDGSDTNYELREWKDSSQTYGIAYGRVHRREIASVEIVQLPSKTSYTYGEALDLNGMRIRVNYVQPENSSVTLEPDTVSPGGMDGIYVTYVDSPDTLPNPSEFSQGDAKNTESVLLTTHPAATGDHLTIAKSVDSLGQQFAHDQKFLMVTARIAPTKGFVTPVARDISNNAIQIKVAPLELTYTLSAENKDYDHTTEARGVITLTNVYRDKNGVGDKVWVVNGTDYSGISLPAGYVFQSSNYNDYGTVAWTEHYGRSEDGIKFSFVNPNVKWETASHDLFRTVQPITVEATNIAIAGADMDNYHINSEVLTNTAQISGRDNAPEAVISPIFRAAPDMAIDLTVDEHTNTVKVLPMKTVDDFRDIYDAMDANAALGQHFEYALIYEDEETHALVKTAYQDTPYFGGEKVVLDIPEFESDGTVKERPEGTGGGQTIGDVGSDFGSRLALPRGTYIGALVRLAQTNNYRVSDGTPSIRDYDTTGAIDNDEDLTDLKSVLATAGAAMQAVYDAIEEPTEQTERIPERVQGPAVKSYTYRIDLVSTSDERDSEGKQVLVPILEEIWFTDNATFETDKNVDRLIENVNPTRYYGYFWDAKRSVRVEFGDKLDLSQDVRVELPQEDENGNSIRVDTLMNANKTVRFYVPVYRSGSSTTMPTKITIESGSGAIGGGGGGAGGGSAQEERTLVLQEDDAPVQLTVNFNPGEVDERKIYWASSDESVVKVSGGGLVTVIGPGTAIIKARSMLGGLTDTILVTVLKRKDNSGVPFTDTMFNAAYEGAFMELTTDGLFEPDRPVSRKELVVIMEHFFRNIEGVDLSPVREYADVPKNAEYMNELRVLERYGIIKGVSEDMFAPDWYATRAEISTILCRMLMLPVGTDPNVPHAFEDSTPEKHWAWPYIDALAKAGITKGTGNNQYSPERVLTRAEIATFIARILVTKLGEVGADTLIPSDMTADHWAYSSVLLAINGGGMELSAQAK